MTEFENYIKNRSPLRSVDKVRYEMGIKAQQVADRFFPDDPEKNKVCADAYLLAMYDMVELIYN
ncbi:MAG: hypothetical protein UR43_C0015G0012 [candidate division TM6 bacterium GW2011_GWF2_33_332]|nr:MAG: hypothetical protein UR43_C0015G0012 [candidate division TM6 bacterium GW2011_GWF2_33_332]